MSYYGGRQPHLKRKDDELYHSGKAGMRWGISNNPLYKAVGKIAKFTMVNGKKVYDSAREGLYGGKSRDIYNQQRQSQGAFNKAASAGSRQKKAERVAQFKQNADDAFNRSLVGRAKSAIDAAGNWAGGLADKIKERGMAAGNWLKDRGRDIGNSAVGKAVSGAAGTAGKWLQDRGTELQGTMNRAREAVGNSAAGKWVKARADEFGNSAAGKWLKDRGNELQGTMKRAGATARLIGNSIKSAPARLRNAVGKAWDGYSGKGTGQDAARMTNNQAMKDRLNEDYNRSIKGTFNRAKNWIGDRGRELQGTVRGAAGSAGKWLQDRGTELQGTMNRAREAVGNSAAGKWIKQRGQELQGTMGRAGKFLSDRGREFQETMGRAGDAVRNGAVGRGLRNIWDGGASVDDYRTERDRIIDLREQSKNSGTSYPERVQERDMENLNNLAKKAHSARENSIVGRAKSAGKWIKQRGQELQGTMGRAGKFISDRGKEFQETLSRAGKTVSNAASSAANTVSNAAGTVANKVTEPFRRNQAYSEYSALNTQFNNLQDQIEREKNPVRRMALEDQRAELEPELKKLRKDWGFN